MVLSKQLITRFFITCCIVSLSGCASQPRKTKASLPLVAEYSDAMPNKVVLPVRYWPVLNSASATQLSHLRYNIKLSSLYTSALGQKCRELTIVNAANEMQKRVACELHFKNAQGKQDKAWFFEPEIAASTYHVEL